GVPEVLRTGTDATVVTYGACCAIALDAASTLDGLGVSCEVIDVQTLNPFDIDHMLVRSLEKTRGLVCVDEDVRGGASGVMLPQILVAQQRGGHLDAAPRTLAA